MSEKPITPTRIIPPGAPLPARPPEDGETPPWRPAPPPPPAVPPPAPAPPPPPPAPMEVEVRITFDPWAEPEPEPEPWWHGLLRIARPWKICAALLAALLPIPGVGHSLGTVWAYTVHQSRTEVGPLWAYGLAIAPALIAARIVHRTGSLRALVLLAISLVGITGALDWWDPIALLTGVRP